MDPLLILQFLGPSSPPPPPMIQIHLKYQRRPFMLKHFCLVQIQPVTHYKLVCKVLCMDARKNITTRAMDIVCIGRGAQPCSIAFRDVFPNITAVVPQLPQMLPFDPKNHNLPR